MTSLRRMTCNDLFTFNEVNLDVLTETYHMPFYQQYLATWPEYWCGLHPREGGGLRGEVDGPPNHAPKPPFPARAASSRRGRAPGRWAMCSARWRAGGPIGTGDCECRPAPGSNGAGPSAASCDAPRPPRAGT